MLRRIDIQTHDVARYVDEQRTGRQLERLGAMRLPAECLPNAMHAHLVSFGGSWVGRTPSCRESAGRCTKGATAEVA